MGAGRRVKGLKGRGEVRGEGEGEGHHGVADAHIASTMHSKQTFVQQVECRAVPHLACHPTNIQHERTMNIST